jgi:hypothetical protein
VFVGGSGVLVGGTGVLVGGTGVFVGGTGVLVGGTGVLVGGTGVLVGGTGVPVPQPGAEKVSMRPLVRPPVLHSYWVKLEASRCMPTVALVPVLVTAPYTTSNTFCPSCSLTSKSSDWAVLAK